MRTIACAALALALGCGGGAGPAVDGDGAVVDVDLGGVGAGDLSEPRDQAVQVCKDQCNQQESCNLVSSQQAATCRSACDGFPNMSFCNNWRDYNACVADCVAGGCGQFISCISSCPACR